MEPLLYRASMAASNALKLAKDLDIVEIALEGLLKEKRIFTYEELTRLNKMVGIALMSGKVELDEISESIHKKIADELINEQTEEKEVV